MRVLLILLVIAVATSAGYGHWHRSTHATLTMSLKDTSGRGRGGGAPNAQLTFLDADSKQLARGKTDDRFGIVMTEHPVAGYCGSDLKPEDYRACFWTQAEWLATWLEDLRYVSLVIGTCRIERVPVDLVLSRDSLLTWWVPLPHLGGVPFSRYRARLEVDSRLCAVTSGRG
ncbi:MAG: hypothetical protein JSU71_13675 [Betaproteobacteria bacterium]|nr:MAG: hypothetical protein JSU71_13675 [Betaproteobacteria bacterium]